MAFVMFNKTSTGTWVQQKQETVTASGFTKQNKLTGNISETVWDGGDTIWDDGISGTGMRTIWDKDTNNGWVKRSGAN